MHHVFELKLDSLYIIIHLNMIGYGVKRAGVCWRSPRNACAEHHNNRKSQRPRQHFRLEIHIIYKQKKLRLTSNSLCVPEQRHYQRPFEVVQIKNKKSTEPQTFFFFSLATPLKQEKLNVFIAKHVVELMLLLYTVESESFKDPAGLSFQSQRTLMTRTPR